MLRKIRIIVAVISLLAMTAMFVDFTGAAAGWLSFLPKVQIVPALLAVNFVAIAVVLALTLLFGRLYCSIICPLGILQDCVTRIRAWLTPKKKRRRGMFAFAAANTGVRVGVLCVFAAAAVLGLTGALAMSYAGLLEPYSIFGRFAGQLLVPAWRTAADAVAESAADHGNFMLDRAVAPSAFSWVLAAVAAIQIVIVLALAVWRGRWYCNTICPVGTALGAISPFSLFKVTIDMDKCVSCGLCGRFCKSACIDTKNHRIDYSRCVACMDCMDHCSTNALGFRFAPGRQKAVESVKKAAKTSAADAGRRSFLIAAGIAGGALAMKGADKVTDGGLAPVKAKQRHSDAPSPVPAGAISMKHFSEHCTACQLCVSECPNGVLKPSLSPSGFMQPQLVFGSDFCRPECVRCSEVCPTGAIRPIDIAEKSAIKIGTAVVDTELCISAAYGQHCGNCARNCPAGAITMVKGEYGMRPAVNAALCIGCGKCEYVCPVGSAGQFSSDVAAIHVVGNEVHMHI